MFNLASTGNKNSENVLAISVQALPDSWISKYKLLGCAAAYASVSLLLSALVRLVMTGSPAYAILKL